MKKVLFLSIIITLWANSVLAETCQERVYRQCMRQEAASSDDSRGGATREDFCIAVAVSQCLNGNS